MAFSNVENRNFQSPVKFNFVVDRLKDFDFYVQGINLPDISLPFLESGTPFATLKVPGNKLRFTDLVVSFKVSEGMYNWYEIFSWLQAMGFPENQKQFGDLRTGNLKDLNGKSLNRQTMRDVGDLYGKSNSQRQYYTAPSTTIPNEQTKFAKWLYQTSSTCKEDTKYCSPQMDPIPYIDESNVYENNNTKY